MIRHAAIVGSNLNYNSVLVTPVQVKTPDTKLCVYCLANQILRADQVLISGDFSYIAAPLGQLTGGFLVIAPYSCGSSLSHLPLHVLREIERLRNLLMRFYRDEYGCANPTFYEQGRAGGGALIDRKGRFPLHAHLCCLPIRCDLHQILGNSYLCRDIESLSDLSSAVGHQPYIYTKTAHRHSVYVGNSTDAQRMLESSRLKPEIAKLHGYADAGDWRNYPGEHELNTLITRFVQFRQGNKL